MLPTRVMKEMYDYIIVTDSNEAEINLTQYKSILPAD